MGSFANTLFKMMLGWLQAAVSAVWSAFTTENGGSLFNWIGRNWLLLAGILCITGLAADLCVYVFRWKPFISAKNHIYPDGDLEEMEKDEEPSSGSASSAYNTHSPEDKPVFRQTETREEQEQPDLSYWENETEKGRPETHLAESDKKPVMVTNAGYVVPADSPYRRPVRSQTEAVTMGADSWQGTGKPLKAEQRNPEPVKPRKRRRLNMGELFANPEEELQEFEVPQRMIDSRKAYRDPVYPRGWKKNEDTEHESDH